MIIVEFLHKCRRCVKLVRTKHTFQTEKESDEFIIKESRQLHEHTCGKSEDRKGVMELIGWDVVGRDL